MLGIDYNLIFCQNWGVFESDKYISKSLRLGENLKQNSRQLFPIFVVDIIVKSPHDSTVSVK